MNSSEFTALLKAPQEISSSQTRGLEAIVEAFPYFQAARAMQLKGLKESKSFSYNKELKMVAAHTVDRSVLFDYITSAEFSQNEIANSLQSRDDYLKNITVFEAEEVVTRRSVAIDDAIKMKLKEAQQVLDEHLFEPQENENDKVVEEENTPKDEEVSNSESKLKLGEPLEFDKNESHSFGEWLKLTSVEPIQRTGSSKPHKEDSDTSLEDTPQNDERAKKFELIDNFIASNPKIKPNKTSTNINLSEPTEVPQERLMTATLARVYLEQKNYKKAIQAYKILILKNPEKSSFFADQIQEIESLIEKQNS